MTSTDFLDRPAYWVISHPSETTGLLESNVLDQVDGER